MLNGTVSFCRWFAKRFLHPDITSIYDYIFIWDEDIGVDNFHPGRYGQTLVDTENIILLNNYVINSYIHDYQLFTSTLR